LGVGEPDAAEGVEAPLDPLDPVAPVDPDFDRPAW
jgi:hypothetical protein